VVGGVACSIAFPLGLRPGMVLLFILLEKRKGVCSVLIGVKRVRIFIRAYQSVENSPYNPYHDFSQKP
jgi:hypothetical protein